MSDLDLFNTNYDFGVDPDDDADGMTTDVIDVPQEDLSPKDFDEEVEAPMVDNSTTKELVVLANPHHKRPAYPRVTDMGCSMCTQTMIQICVPSFDSKS